MEGRVSAATQTQAACALPFLYREVLGRELSELAGVVRAKQPVRLPMVLTREEVARSGGAAALVLPHYALEGKSETR